MTDARASTIIDAARGAAALLVLFAHSDAYGLLPLVKSAHLRGVMGTVGVDLFFLLSGFLIWRSAMGALPDWRTYAIHRLTRVVPLYLVVIAFVVVAEPLFRGGFNPEVTAGNVLRHLTFTQDLQSSVSRTLNPVLWTLTHEAIFYALVPLIWLGRRWVWAVLPLSAVGYVLVVHNPDGTFASFGRVAPLFAIGLVVAHYRLAMGWAAVIASVAVAVVCWRHASPLSHAATALALFVTMRALPAGTHGMFIPIAWVGLVSYSLYVWHYLLIEVYGANTAALPRWVLAGGYVQEVFVALLMAVTVLSYWVVERPAMVQLRRQLLAANRKMQPAPVKERAEATG